MAEEYIHQDYPKMLYHEDGRVAIVETKEQEHDQKKEAGWHDSPAAYGVETAPAAPAGQVAGYRVAGYVKPPTPAPQTPPVGAAPASTASEAESGRRRP